ncbi:MAG: hypothetical protein QNI89_19290 [Desulfobacterales bacterium]|nr:hypothetical protein [Desulfobacterales bacterium]
MTTIPPASFNALVEQYLGQRLPPAMADTIDLPGQPKDARALMRRMLGLMKSARFPATDFNPFLTGMLATMVPGVLPCSWGGRIPPLTVPGRHRKLDVYVAAQDCPRTRPRPVFIDLGCGFPPVTTVDTARALPHWKIFGVDRFFATDVVYDNEGHYACFDAEGTYRYFQPMMTRSGMALYADPEATRKHFEKLFETLAPRLPEPGDSTMGTAAWNGHRLVRNPIREFESGNLVFLEAEIQTLQLPPAKAARCMNVLVYFPPPVQKEILRTTGSFLSKGGLLIAGTSGFGIDARYTVYRQTDSGLIPSEFAFSFENLRSLGIMPYFAIHDGDREASLLADLMGAIRADPSYWPALNHRVDALLAQKRISRRDSEGFLQPPPEEISGSAIRDRMAAMWQQLVSEGYLSGALEALERAGFEAWENPAGDIAVRPPKDYGV